MYCNKYLCQYSALYFHKIDKISVKIKIIDENNDPIDKLFFDFDDDTNKTTFFNDTDVKQILEKYMD